MSKHSARLTPASRNNRRATLAAKRRKGRTCEVCGADYNANYAEQRTCGRTCGEILKRQEYGPFDKCEVHYLNCAECGTLFASNRKRKICGEQCRNRRRNRTTSQAIMKRYYTDPDFRDKIIAAAQARRAEKLGIGNKKITITYLWNRDKRRCGICHKPIRSIKQASLDHIVPLNPKTGERGTHDLENVQLAHLTCNIKKGNRGGGEQLLAVG